jgi:hypothetical protein
MNRFMTGAALAALMIAAPAMAGSWRTNAHCCVCDTCGSSFERWWGLDDHWFRDRDHRGDCWSDAHAHRWGGDQDDDP